MSIEEQSKEDRLSFARAYRPTDYSGYIGNEDLVDTLRRTVQGVKPQSILLEGHSGCGKTTVARIVASAYCCEDLQDGNPCGFCSSCVQFNEYITTGVVDNIPDIYEIDAADTSGKKAIDGMLSSMEYPPMSFPWKVYIIDEAHKLSTDAMGRLLKSLEEPPEGVLMVLCTNEPENLLDTIVNRCQLKLKVTKPKTSEIIKLLANVCLLEGKEYDTTGLRILAGRAENVVRDSLNHLETVLNVRGNAKADSVNTQFKQISDNMVFDFYNAYYSENYTDYIDVIYKIKTEYEFSQFLTSLINFTVRGIYIINGVVVDGLTDEEFSSYTNLFKKFKPEELSIILQGVKSLASGNIEANLISFMYCKNNTLLKVDSKPKEEVSISRESEVKMRNDNLKKIENAKLSKGESSVQSELEEVSVADLGAFFSLEKVNL